MANEIAVILDNAGRTTSFTERGNVVVFIKKMGEWHRLRAKEFTLVKALIVKGVTREENG